MTSYRSLRMLFSVSLFLGFCVLFAVAGPTESSAVQDRVEAASCQRCGDGYCAPSCENERTCPADCKSTKLAVPAAAPTAPAASAARCGRCGDGQCVKSCGETALSCPIDCGGGPGEPSAASAQPAPCEAQPQDEAAK